MSSSTTTTTTTEPLASYSDNQKEIERLKALAEPPLKTKTDTSSPKTSSVFSLPLKPSLHCAEALIKTPISQPSSEYSFKLMDTLKDLVPDTAFQVLKDPLLIQYPQTKPLTFPAQVQINLDNIQLFCKKQLPPELKDLDSVLLCKTMAAHTEHSKDIGMLSIALFSILKQLDAFSASRKTVSQLFDSSKLSLDLVFLELFAEINKDLTTNEELKTQLSKGLFVSFSDPKKTSIFVNDDLSFEEQYTCSSGIRRAKSKPDEYNTLASILQNKILPPLDTNQKKNLKPGMAAVTFYSFHGETEEIKQFYTLLLGHLNTMAEEFNRLRPFFAKLQSCQSSEKHDQVWCLVVFLALYFESGNCYYLMLFLIAHVKLRNTKEIRFDENKFLMFVVELISNIKEMEVINDKIKFLPANKFEFSLFQNSKEIQTHVQMQLLNVNSLQITAAKEIATRKRDLLITQVSHSNQTSVLEFLMHYVTPPGGSDILSDATDDQRRRDILTVLQKPHLT